tara:strand:+ start:1797 stop:2063 length:267 start_codon:yes stop_codon:yes gene_type:complete
MKECYEIYYKDCRDNEEDEETKKETVYISIKMPDRLMNESADSLGVETTLTFNHTDVFVKCPYNKYAPFAFNVFDADEKLECIEDYLG